MQDTRLPEIFQNTKETICKYDYYIHTSKRILHLTNTEDLSVLTPHSQSAMLNAFFDTFLEILPIWHFSFVLMVKKIKTF